MAAGWYACGTVRSVRAVISRETSTGRGLAREVMKCLLLFGGPPSAHGAIQLHRGDELVPLRLGEGELRPEQAALRVQYVEVARHAVPIAHVRELERPAQRDRLALLRRAPVLGGPQSHERVFHFAQRHEHGLLVA